jgi:hypothetical protein
MVNQFSRCLLAMAFFASVSAPLGWQVISYALFATGIAAIVLTDFAIEGRWKTGAGMCIALPGVGLLGGPNPALLMIIPVAAAAVFLAEHLTRMKTPGEGEPRESSKRRDDPLANLCVSLPSAVALLAFVALC